MWICPLPDSNVKRKYLSKFRQHDIRTTHRCNSGYANVLVNLINHLGRYAEAKCVAVNPRRPYQLAVGANDFYVRLYDTRMIKLSKVQVNLRPQSIQAFLLDTNKTEKITKFTTNILPIHRCFHIERQSFLFNIFH